MKHKLNSIFARNNYRDVLFKDKKIKVYRAFEPKDIIWHHWNLSLWTLIKLRAKVILIILVLLIICSILISFFAVYANNIGLHDEESNCLD